MKAWKRCIAAVLSFLIFTTSVNISEAAGTYDTENFIWKADEAEIVAGYYGLDEKEVAVLKNNAINGGYEYVLLAPYANGTEEKTDLIAVDYVNKKVYAKALYTGGLAWLPTTAVLSVEGEEKENISLKAGVCYYNEVEYYASEAFIYDGYSYTVEVIYQLDVEVSSAEQERILQIPAILTQTAVNLEKNLDGVYSDVKDLGDMITALEELLTYEFIREEVIENEETGEKEKIETTEPAFDSEEDADVIAAIEALYQEYTDNEGLILYNLSGEYRKLGGKNILSYTFEKGAQILEESIALYEHVCTLKASSRLRSVYKELYKEEPELYQQLKNLQKVLGSLAGNALGSGELENLQDTANWTILDENVRAQIFAESYTEEDFKQLETAVYTLRNSEPKYYSVETETLVASKIGIKCDITIYDITVSMNAAVVSGLVDDSEVFELETFGTSFTLLEGATEEEIITAIEKSGIENTALSAWNSLSSEYQINLGYYDRKVSGVPGKLYNNVECIISYTPKYYSVKTNFRGNAKVPYGFQIEFPVSDDDEISYEYVVETESGAKIYYNEGVKYKVTQPVTIKQLEAVEKVEYRLYDFLINDPQYNMSEEMKQILANTAVDSPTLKIRKPDGRTVSDIIQQDDGSYYIEAQDYSAGGGMTWEPDYVYLMDNDTLLCKVPFEENAAVWTQENFTHVNVIYRLKIEKVSNLILYRDIDEAKDVLYALNLPHDMVTHTVEQNQLLCGDGDISAKLLYSELAAVNQLINEDNFVILAACMESDKEKDALLRLQGSENQIIKGQNGQSLGYGAWNTANNELALYTYLKLCANTNWSLATYYEQELNEKIARQTEIVADCLEVIIAAPNFRNLIKNSDDYKAKVAKIEEMLPKLRQLSEEISGPHEAILTSDDSYEELIELLLSMEGKTASVESSNGIYAYTTIRRNGGNSGSLTVSVQVGSKSAQTKEISYAMESETHILTDAEAAQIAQYIVDLESACGMTEDEKQYYKLVATAVPQAGTSVGKNETVSLTYLPKEYTVTIKGVPEYKATFKYKSNYVITLPPYSTKDPDAIKYYRYWIDEETWVKAENVDGGYYAFTKEDLTTKFVNDCYELYGREEILVIPEVDITVGAELNEKVLRGYDVVKNPGEQGWILLDVNPNGITQSQFSNLVTFTYGEGLVPETKIENSNRDPARQSYLASGAKVTCTAYDENGDPHDTVYTIIIMGDVNKNGKVDMSDVEIIARNYLGTAAETENMSLDGAILLAADMNRNDNSTDSNDALQIIKKVKYWNATDGKKYESILTK